MAENATNFHAEVSLWNIQAIWQKLISSNVRQSNALVWARSVVFCVSLYSQWKGKVTLRWHFTPHKTWCFGNLFAACVFWWGETCVDICMEKLVKHKVRRQISWLKLGTDCQLLQCQACPSGTKVWISVLQREQITFWCSACGGRGGMAHRKK